MTKRNGYKKPASSEDRSGALNRRLKILIAAAVFWILLFIVVLAEHARSWARLLPVVGVVWVCYAAYATWKFFTDKRND
jgi:uncharacterized membrane protein YbhN (UPF0104 family)